MECNKTQASLRFALTTLDSYYRDISISAGDVNKKYKTLKREYEEVLVLLNRKDDEIANLTQKIRAYKEQATRAEEEKQRLKSIVNDYVYPDIANSLLAADGDLVNAETIIDKNNLSANIISGDTKIERNPESHGGHAVIRNLFEEFVGD